MGKLYTMPGGGIFVKQAREGTRCLAKNPPVNQNNWQKMAQPTSERRINTAIVFGLFQSHFMEKTRESARFFSASRFNKSFKMYNQGRNLKSYRD